MRFLDLQAQRDSLEPQLSQAMDQVMRDGDFINGRATRDFESAFADYVGAGYCVGCANGTDALELILESIPLHEGDEVIVPAMTFVATSEAVIRSGGKPILVDVDRSVTLDFEMALAAVTDRTRAIIVVHLYGYPVDIPLLHEKLAAMGRQDVLVIEDAAQAHGAQIRSSRVGSLGHAAAFSFYPGKTLGAFGDAGGVTTSNQALAEHIRRVANHGRLGKFDHAVLGRNSRLDSIQAAVLKVKLGHLDEWLKRRRDIATRYLCDLGPYDWLELPAVPQDGQHGWHQFAVLVPERQPFIDHLEESGVPTGIHYPVSLPQLPIHDDSDSAQFPRAMQVANHEVSLPIGEHLTDTEVEKVIAAVSTFTR